MALKIDLRKVAADALDMAITPDNVSALSKHDKQYHPDGYEEGQFCKFRQAMERGDSADKLDAAEQEEAATKAEVARLVKRLEDVGRLILTAPEDEGKYAAILDSYGFKKGDADYQKAYDTIYNAAEAYDAMGDEGGDAVGELKAAVLRVDEALSTMKKPKAQVKVKGEGEGEGEGGKRNSSASQPLNSSTSQHSSKQDRDDLYEIREYLEKCARLLNGRAGNVAAIQASGRWPLLKEVTGGKLGKEIGDRLDEMAKGGDAAVAKAVGLLKPVYDKIVQSSKSGWTVKPGMIVGEEDLFEEEDAEDGSFEWTTGRNPEVKGGKITSLADHDKKFHPNGFKEGDSCKFRENLKKKDSADRIGTGQSAGKEVAFDAESEDHNNKLKIAFVAAVSNATKQQTKTDEKLTRQEIKDGMIQKILDATGFNDEKFKSELSLTLNEHFNGKDENGNQNIIRSEMTPEEVGHLGMNLYANFSDNY